MNEKFEKPEMSLSLLVENLKKKGSMEKGVLCLQKWKLRVCLCPYSNTCRISGSEWSGRSSTGSSCEDGLRERTWEYGDQPLPSPARDLGTAAPHPVPVQPLILDQPRRDALTSTSAFPFVSQILFLQRNFGAVKGVRDTPKPERDCFSPHFCHLVSRGLQPHWVPN